MADPANSISGPEGYLRFSYPVDPNSPREFFQTTISEPAE